MHSDVNRIRVIFSFISCYVLIKNCMLCPCEIDNLVDQRFLCKVSLIQDLIGKLYFRTPNCTLIKTTIVCQHENRLLNMPKQLHKDFQIIL